MVKMTLFGVIIDFFGTNKAKKALIWSDHYTLLSACSDVCTTTLFPVLCTQQAEASLILSPLLFHPWPCLGG